MALPSVTSLPLRFAAGRDLMAQVGRRVLGDGLVWLGVPFRSQIDGGEFQYVNCGPASLTMVLAAFGLEVGPVAGARLPEQPDRQLRHRPGHQPGRAVAHRPRRRA